MILKFILNGNVFNASSNVKSAIKRVAHRRYSQIAHVTPVLSWKMLAEFRDKIGFADYPTEQLSEITRLSVTNKLKAYTYGNLFDRSATLAKEMRRILDTDVNVDQENVAFLCPNDSNYIVTLLGCWLSGCGAVPLCKTHPLHHLEYYVKDCSAALLVGTSEYQAQVTHLSTKFGIPHLIVPPSPAIFLDDSDNDPLKKKLDHVDGGRRALILYTSGTTGPPKGVVLTHANLRAQVDALTAAWKITKTDSLLHCLPLHHLHGVLNGLLVPLSVGASVVMMPKFDANEVWQQLTTSAETSPTRVNMFMGVPTMYVKLLETYDAKYKAKTITEQFIRASCEERIRLMVSGSSALPGPIFERWEKVTGHRLLERFGMTEIGMGLTNPLNGPRKPGFVGNPLPNVRTRIVKRTLKDQYEVIALGDEYKTVVSAEMEDESGELQIQGPNVFHQYWNKPEETSAPFTTDGWFNTGDVVQYVDGSYKILGRASVDILKSGGFKISALDVENQLLSHNMVAECAVVGLKDITWGQKIAAVIVLKTKTSGLSSDKIREWAKTRLPHYSVPSVVLIVDQLPRSPIGKINKKELVKQLFPQDS